MAGMNIQIDEQLHREAKVEAAKQGISIKDLTERAIRDYLWTHRLVDTRELYTTKEDSHD